MNIIDGIKWTYGFWEFEGHGNHRAKVVVKDASDYNRVRINWRRHDKFPSIVNPIIEFEDGIKVNDYYVNENTNLYGDIVFKPECGSGVYYFYYYPFDKFISDNEHYLNNYPIIYLTFTGGTKEALKRKIPIAKCEEIQYRETKDHPGFNSFYPMEVTASQEEVDKILDYSVPFMTFFEDAKHPIKMKDFLPYRWIKKGASKEASFNIKPGEIKAFQIGVYAHICDLKDLTVETPEGITCINTEGVDYKGEHFTKTLYLKKGQVQALWFLAETDKDINDTIKISATPFLPSVGLLSKKSALANLPLKFCEFWGDVTEGDRGDVSLKTGRKNLKNQKSAELFLLNSFELDFPISITVKGSLSKDKGFDDMYSMARLAWLNDQTGTEDKVPYPYTNVEVKTVPLKPEKALGGGSPERTDGGMEIPKLSPTYLISILDRQIKFNSYGLPTSIVSRGNELLADELFFDFGAPLKSKIKLSSKGNTYAEFISKWETEDFKGTTTTRAEFDGCIDVSVKIISKKAQVADNSLQIPLRKEMSKYLMGYCKQGGYRTEDIDWKWNENQNSHKVWIGDTDGGLYLDLRDTKDTFSMFYNSNFGNPPSWYNEGLGGSKVYEKGDKVFINAYTGDRFFKAGEKIEFNFRLLVTPFHKIFPEHWKAIYSNSGTK
ncbi:MAG: hypothetical protein IK121_03365, partial [Lachnospiraceae bacterium]|nr:hypothetical protein [Lachnospiraceae bacterium]